MEPKTIKPRKSRAKKATVPELPKSRQVARADLFRTHFTTMQMDGTMKHCTKANPGSVLPNRKQRRQLARAYSIGQWRMKINSPRLAKGSV